jgi:hypothetical protein
MSLYKINFQRNNLRTKFCRNIFSNFFFNLSFCFIFCQTGIESEFIQKKNSPIVCGLYSSPAGLSAGHALCSGNTWHTHKHTHTLSSHSSIHEQIHPSQTHEHRKPIKLLVSTNFVSPLTVKLHSTQQIYFVYRHENFSKEISRKKFFILRNVITARFTI